MHTYSIIIILCIGNKDIILYNYTHSNNIMVRIHIEYDIVRNTIASAESANVLFCIALYVPMYGLHVHC